MNYDPRNMSSLGSEPVSFPGSSPSLVGPSANDTLPILIVLHGEMSTPGRVGNALRARGHALDIRRPRFGDKLPPTLTHHAGAVIFGGPMSANDTDDFVKQEIDWIAVPLLEQRPFLGICLGAQMLARHLGARVSPHHQGRAEIGYYPINPTRAGLGICPEWPSHVYQWHREGFELPAGCELLAEGGDFPVQAFRQGSAFGLQFHPDVTSAMMHRWTTRGHTRMELAGARPRAEHFEQRAVHHQLEMQWLDTFLDGWLANHHRIELSEHNAMAAYGMAAE
jgi:GMP synthase (glutamine-hydrolysing)